MNILGLECNNLVFRKIINEKYDFNWLIIIRDIRNNNIYYYKKKFLVLSEIKICNFCILFQYLRSAWFASFGFAIDSSAAINHD